ncbi:FHA domain-containing protein [Actinomadura verrucosospora]|uniref:FHA domain containing protein n=1 Tax=Actinomadura verrucosospora TaxID=46165 RepID=A0A7D3VXW7_ACTVE|nr:FHA domain-containing protein [Actinomadura verrucosospora]QKG26060.1 FHA domain containing protein [Actinomadura verrucosospora]
MAICPNGHTSQAADYCDDCGELIGGAAPAPASPAGAPPGPPAGGSGTRTCPDCGEAGADRFCEICGYDFATGGGKPTPDRTAPPPPGPDPGGADSAGGTGPTGVPERPAPRATGWTAVVAADRDYYNAVLAEEGPDSSALSFPPYAPERRIPLAGQQIRIGRRSSAQPAPPEIDLREPPEDPGVSHVHAVLLAKPDGSWTLVDPGSRNRTCLNGSTEPIPLNEEVPVSAGDRIHVGAWTTITLTRDEAP